LCMCLVFFITGFIPEFPREFGTGGNMHGKEKDRAEDTKPRSPMERRIEELITQCKGVPPGEVMQLLLAADSSKDFDLEKKLQELFEKYNEKN
jgi:hypothetical protein